MTSPAARSHFPIFLLNSKPFLHRGAGRDKTKGRSRRALGRKRSAYSGLHFEQSTELGSQNSLGQEQISHFSIVQLLAGRFNK